MARAVNTKFARQLEDLELKAQELRDYIQQ
jgi:hypothetical protein